MERVRNLSEEVRDRVMSEQRAGRLLRAAAVLPLSAGDAVCSIVGTVSRGEILVRVLDTALEEGSIAIRERGGFLSESAVSSMEERRGQVRAGEHGFELSSPGARRAAAGEIRGVHSRRRLYRGSRI